MSTNPTGPARSTWTTQKIRACDLTGTDTVLIEGIWREVLDVWTGDDDPAAEFGAGNPTTLAILAKTDWSSPCWIAVRFVDEDRSNDMESMDSLHFFRLRDLVEVQQEIPPTHFTTRVPNQRTTE